MTTSPILAGHRSELLEAAIRAAIGRDRGPIEAAFYTHDLDRDMSDITLVAEEHTDSAYEVLGRVERALCGTAGTGRVLLHLRAHQGRQATSVAPPNAVRVPIERALEGAK